MSENTFTRQVLQDNTVVIDTGRVLDNNNAHEMVTMISNCQAEGYVNIILDMAQLEFLSSAGVGSILGTIEVSREAGGDIVLCNVSPNILHILEVLDIDEYLKISGNREEASSACLNNG